MTLTNSHAQDAAEVSINLLGEARVETAAAILLTGEIHAHNTLDQPEVVAPGALNVETSGSTLKVILPPASVAGIKILVL